MPQTRRDTQGQSLRPRPKSLTDGGGACEWAKLGLAGTHSCRPHVPMWRCSGLDKAWMLNVPNAHTIHDRVRLTQSSSLRARTYFHYIVCAIGRLSSQSRQIHSSKAICTHTHTHMRTRTHTHTRTRVSAGAGYGLTDSIKKKGESNNKMLRDNYYVQNVTELHPRAPIGLQLRRSTADGCLTRGLAGPAVWPADDYSTDMLVRLPFDIFYLFMHFYKFAKSVRRPQLLEFKRRRKRKASHTFRRSDISNSRARWRSPTECCCGHKNSRRRFVIPRPPFPLDCTAKNNNEQKS